MYNRYSGACAAALVLSVFAGRAAGAAIGVDSSQLLTGSGHYTVFRGPPGIDSAPTTYVAGAFPNDASNFVTSDGSSLSVLVNQTAVHSVAPQPANQYFSSESWTSKKFEVVFHVDVPVMFAFTLRNTKVTWSAPQASLKQNGGGTELITQGGFSGAHATSGELSPGTYTFSGMAGIEGTSGLSPLGGGAPAQYPSVLEDVSLVVTVPEPGLGGVAASVSVVLAAARRRRR